MTNTRGRYLSGEPTIAELVADLSKRVADLEAGNRIGYTSVDLGSLNIQGGQFQVGSILYLGPVTMGSDTSDGWIFRRADGASVFVLGGASNMDQFWALYDNEQNIIVSDDGQTNRGLARPYINIPFGLHYNFTFPAATTSGSFGGMWIARFPKQHPRVQVDVLAKMSDGTTAGEIRLLNNTTGQVIAGPTAIAAGFLGVVQLGPVDLTLGSTMNLIHMGTIELEVQMRRTAGAGNVSSVIYSAYGLQS